GLVVRQEATKGETERLLAKKVVQKKQLTEAQTASVGDLAAEQDALAIEARTIGQGPQLPSAFALQLEWTAEDMSSAVRKLCVVELDDAVIASQASALSR